MWFWELEFLICSLQEEILIKRINPICFYHRNPWQKGKAF